MKSQHGILSLVLTAAILSGCSTFSKNQESSRELLIRKDWVRQSTQKVNPYYRKINRAQPLRFGNLILVSNAIDGVMAYNADSGQEVWRVSLANGSEATAALINDRLFLGASDGQFYSINAKTGAVLWTFPTRTEVLSEPLIEEGHLYFLAGNNSLYALDAATGKQLWLYTRQETSALSVRGGSKPAFRNGTLYVGFSDGAVVALLAQNGAVKWEKQLSKNKKFRDVDSDPLIEGDYLYVGGFDDAVYCLRAATGEQVWKAENGSYGKFLLVGDLLYFASTSDEFVAVQKSTGQRTWAWPVKGGIATGASYYRGLVVFGESQGKVRFLDSSKGKQMGSFEPGRGVLTQPLADEKNSRIYFMSGEANMYSLEVNWGIPKRIPYLR